MISRFPSLFFYQAFLYIAVFLSFEMLSFFANVSRIIPWITINYSWYEWNRFVSKKCLATFNFWHTSISQRALSLLMFIITCQANFRILHPLKKTTTFKSLQFWKLSSNFMPSVIIWYLPMHLFHSFITVSLKTTAPNSVKHQSKISLLQQM